MTQIELTNPQPRFTFGQIIEGVEGAFVCAACYLTLPLQPLRKRWGLTREEANRTYPGDQWVEHPSSIATHAIEIDGTSEQVWPWIAQIGQSRGGFYSYEALENLFGYQIYNSSRILPEFQNTKVGDGIPFAPGQSYPVIEIEPGRNLVIGVFIDLDTGEKHDPTTEFDENFMHVSWLFHLETLARNRTRMVSRCRVKLSPKFRNRVFGILYEPVMFTMDRKMLKGIKKRVETSNVNQRAGSQ